MKQPFRSVPTSKNHFKEDRKMKKTIAAIIALVLVFALCACGRTPAEPPVNNMPDVPAPETSDVPDVPTGLIGLPNPMTEYDSLDKLNVLLGVRLVRPAVMGVTNESFYLINGGIQVAQYGFTLNGIDYTFRASPVYDTDISGYYVGDDTAFSGIPTGELEYAEYEGTKLARWATIDGQYVLAGENASENFAAVAEELASRTLPGLTGEPLAAYYESLAGTYSDATSLRAMLFVEADGADGLLMTASWSNSAFELTEWKMTTHLDADGLLSYSDLTESHINNDADGKQTIDLVRENGAGYFVESEGKLLWVGADNEQCSACVFVKAEDLYGQDD